MPSLRVTRSAVALELSATASESQPRGCYVVAVALESTVVTHRLPYPHNLRLALRLEEIVREGGAAPVTVCIIAGQTIVGLSRDQIEHLAPTLELRANDLVEVQIGPTV